MNYFFVKRDLFTFVASSSNHRNSCHTSNIVAYCSSDTVLAVGAAWLPLDSVARRHGLLFLLSLMLFVAAVASRCPFLRAIFLSGSSMQPWLGYIAVPWQQLLMGPMHLRVSFPDSIPLCMQGCISESRALGKQSLLVFELQGGQA